jgi:hypothetical protein
MRPLDSCNNFPNNHSTPRSLVSAFYLTTLTTIFSSLPSLLLLHIAQPSVVIHTNFHIFALSSSLSHRQLFFVDKMNERCSPVSVLPLSRTLSRSLGRIFAFHEGPSAERSGEMKNTYKKYFLPRCASVRRGIVKQLSSAARRYLRILFENKA